MLLTQDIRFGNPILDSRFQIEWAFELARGQGGDRLFFQSPLYAYVISFVIRVLGWQPVLIGVVQLALVLLSAGCVAVAAWSLGVRRQVALGVTAVALFWPTFAFFAADLNKTALEIFLHAALLGLGCYVLTVDGRRGSSEGTSRCRPWLELRAGREHAAWAAWGLLFGLAALVRASFQVLPLVVLPFAFARRQVRLLAFGIGFLLPVGWAVGHNTMVAGQLLPVQTSGGYNLYVGNNRHNPVGTQQEVPGVSLVPVLEEPTANETAARALGRPLQPREVNAYYLGQVWDFFVQEPGAFVSIWFEKLRRYGHKIELPDNECFPCTADEMALIGWNPLRFDWLLWLAVACAALVCWNFARAPSQTPFSQLFPVFFGVALAVSVIAFFLNSRLRVGHVTVWLVVIAQGVEFLLRTRAPAVAMSASPARRARVWLVLVVGLVPGLWWIFQGPLADSYHPDNFTAKKAVVQSELGYAERARSTARSVEDPYVRSQLLAYLTRLEAGQELPLLSPVIPKRRP